MEFDLSTIVTWLLGAATIFAGGWVVLIKKKSRKLVRLGKESLDVVVACVDALEDDKLTNAEIDLIKEEALDVADAWAELISKE